VQFSRIGDTISVSSLGDAITFTVSDGTFPPTEELLLSDSEGEPSAIEGVALNPAFMADYAKIAGKKVRLLRSTLTITWRTNKIKDSSVLSLYGI
jgi:hypothetical protein